MSYPPHVEAKRRTYGLPITPAEHVAYEHGETTEPPVTVAQMVEIYRRVAPRCAPLFAAVLRDIMVRCVAGGREPGED